MKQSKFVLAIFIALFCIASVCHAQDKTEQFVLSKNWQPLLNKDLSNWEIFVGAPHSSVELEGFPKSDNVNTGTPLGLNNDVKNVMSIIEEEGEQVLYITGEIYAGLTSLQEFENYHLKVQFKWGGEKMGASFK